MNYYKRNPNKPFQEKKRPDPAEFPLTPQEIRKIINTEKNFSNRVILEFLAYMGLREFEVAKIMIQEIDFKRKRLFVLGKREKEAILPIPDRLFADILALIGKKKAGYLFEGRKPNTHINRTTVNYITKHAGINAGVENPYPHTDKSRRYKFINPHIFRHSFVHFLFSKKVNPRIIQNLARHNRPDTTFKYGKENMDEIQETYDNVIGDL